MTLRGWEGLGRRAVSRVLTPQPRSSPCGTAPFRWHPLGPGFMEVVTESGLDLPRILSLGFVTPGCSDGEG